MKTVKQTMLVVLGLLFFALQGCSHDDYIPVPGPAGVDGTNGVAGTAYRRIIWELKIPMVRFPNIFMVPIQQFMLTEVLTVL